MVMPRKLRCQVARITDHGGHVYTVDLVPEHKIPRFRPGHFLHLALDAYDPSDFWPESRVFSIASSPHERTHLRISYSVVGRFTTRMEQELATGRSVWVKLPYGDFVIDGQRDVVLFAGGTGITAFIAFIAGLETDFSYRVNLFYGARKPGLFLYRDIIEACAQRAPQFTVHYFVEKAVDAFTRESPVATKGRLSISSAWSTLQEPLETDYYLSGPPSMLMALSKSLGECAIPADAIKVDAWE